VNDKNSLLNELRIDRSAPVEPPSRAPWIVAAAVLALVAAAGGWFALRGPDPVVVKTARAQAMAQGSASASVLDATGYVVARRQATVSAKITGKVREVMIEEGMRVSEGQVMARLDDTDAQAQLALSHAQLGAAQSQLVEWRAQVAQAERDTKRQQDLIAQKLVSQSALEAARTQLETYRARLASQTQSVEVSRRALELAQVQLDNTVVRAPYAGVITVKAAQPGEMVSPLSAGGGFTRTGIGTLVDMDSLEVEVDVNEAYINRVQSGQPAEAVLNAYAEWKIPAEVIAIIPTADRSKATVKVRVALKQKDARIVPDMGVRVAFLEERKPETAGAPAAPKGVLVDGNAVRKDGDQDVVYVLRNGKAERRAVRVGGSVGTARQVLSGLAAGDAVIVEGPDTLKDGDEVVEAKAGG